MAKWLCNKLLPLKDRPKFTQIGIFGFENMPSGNPAYDAVAATDTDGGSSAFSPMPFNNI
jgi:hypothetical protein